MAKESLEMLFRELKALETGQTDSTQVYQVAPLHHLYTHTLNNKAYKHD